MRKPRRGSARCQTNHCHLFLLLLLANASRRHGTSRKWQLFQRVQELHASGMSLRKIGEELGLARNTVRKYVRQPEDATAAHAATTARESTRSLRGLPARTLESR